MAKARDGKREALARDGALNPHPDAIRDSLFVENPFFDPADLVQVRYEMVRRHQEDGQPVSEVAANFGVSRPTFYKAQAALEAGGLPGLLPHQRGPKGGHKLSAAILAFDAELRTRGPEPTMAERLAAIEGQFGVKLHRRSLERALARKKNDGCRRTIRREPPDRHLRGAAYRRADWLCEGTARPRHPGPSRPCRLGRRDAAGSTRQAFGRTAGASGRCRGNANRTHPRPGRNHRRSDDRGHACTCLR